MANWNKGIIILKFIATLLITYSHMKILFPPAYYELVTGGAIGDGLFFFCSGYTLFLGRRYNFIDWYKRRINRIYPTIIMWALLSSFIFSWSWSVSDLVMTPRYWFISCIMIYYIIFYIIRSYVSKYLNVTLGILSLIVIISYFYVLDLDKSVMYSYVPYMRIYYILFMILGAICGYRTHKNISAKKAGLYTLLNLVLYYACMLLYKVDPFFCKFQIISLLPLLFSIYWMFRFCDTHVIHKILDLKYIGKLVYYISSLTLEVYIVQSAIFTDKFNDYFPINIAIIYVLIFIVAYLLKCMSRIFSQVFSDMPFNIKEVYKL